MKLMELDPRWTCAVHGREGQGVIFLCPKCKDHYLGVWFQNPIDGKDPYIRPGQDHCNWWSRTGATFETLTIAPSIQIVGCCGWHGFVRDGEIITV